MDLVRCHDKSACADSDEAATLLPHQGGRNQDGWNTCWKRFGMHMRERQAPVLRAGHQGHLCGGKAPGAEASIRCPLLYNNSVATCRASSSSLWRWSARSGSLTRCATCTTRSPSRRPSSSATPSARRAIVVPLCRQVLGDMQIFQWWYVSGAFQTLACPRLCLTQGAG